MPSPGEEPTGAIAVLGREQRRPCGPEAAGPHRGATVVHVLPPEAKVVATLVTVLAVVATPREAVGAFVAHLILLGAVVALARLPPRLVLRRARVEVPFLVFAALLPFVSPGPQVEVAGLTLSADGLWAGWNIAAKGTLGVLAAVVLAATTPVPELLRGLQRLRVPAALVAIAGFMARYLEVVVGEAGRMRVARLSRGDDPRWLWQAQATAATAGTLFVRSYERGERVHLAMLSRGSTGAMPVLHRHRPPARAWLGAAAVPAVAVTITTVALAVG